jgi:hypothetical protein
MNLDLLSIRLGNKIKNYVKEKEASRMLLNVHVSTRWLENDSFDGNTFQASCSLYFQTKSLVAFENESGVAENFSSCRFH